MYDLDYVHIKQTINIVINIIAVSYCWQASQCTKLWASGQTE